MGQTSGFPRGADSAVPASTPMLMVGGYGGSFVNPVAINAAGILSSTVQANAMVSAGPGQWAIQNSPAAGSQATISKAAGGAGVRHVCRGIVATVANSAATASTVLTVQIRDGASGAGTVLWQINLAIPATANQCIVVALSDLNIIGSANTAMTFEFNGAPPANVQQNVNITGYSTT